MSGTGFFDQVDFVDTSGDPPKQGEIVETAPQEAINPDPVDEGQSRILDHIIETDVHWGTHLTVDDILAAEPPLPQGNPEPLTFTSPGAHIVAEARRGASHTHDHVLCLIYGPQKCGKSGIVLDSLTPEEIEAGAEIWLIDFDMGGDSTKGAHHADKKDNIIILPPWVLAEHDSRVPFDFPKTYQRVLGILNHAYEVTQAQHAYFLKNGELPKPYLKTICFDGADQWLNICSTLMKVNDLELGPDGIATTGQKTTTKIGRFNWEIRANRYRAAITTGLQEIARFGVHCYVITHMKPSYDSNGNEILGADIPAILPRSEGDYQQTISINLIEERNERGEKDGVVHSVGQVVENRTSLKAGERILLFRRGPDGGEWYGWPGLRDGTFSSPNDVLAPLE